MKAKTVRPRLLTTGEVAADLRTTQGTVRRLVAAGTLRGFRLSPNGPLRIFTADVERLAGGGEVESP